MAIKLGTLVTDTITGFTGVAMSRTEFVYGCVRIRVQPKKLVAGKIVEAEHLDELMLKENDRSTTPPPSALLGTVDTDTITGISGTVASYTTYAGEQGPRVFLQPKGMTDEGKAFEGVVVDEAQLESVQKRLKQRPASESAPRKTAGPGDIGRRQDIGRR